MAEEHINDLDRQLEQAIWREGQDYAERGARAKKDAEARKDSRNRLKERGLDPNAFHVAVGLVKRKTPRQLKDWLRDFNAAVAVLSAKQADLFPEEAAAALKREQAKEARAPLSGKEGAPNPDTNPRSDPEAGGAKPRTGRPRPEKPSATGRPTLTVVGKDAGQMAPVPGTSMEPPPVPDEQAEGDAVLNAGLTETKSQSQKAREKAEAAGVPST